MEMSLCISIVSNCTCSNSSALMHDVLCIDELFKQGIISYNASFLFTSLICAMYHVYMNYIS